MAIERFAENPLIRPADVVPSRPDFGVVCVFNCGAIRVGDETLLLLRVAERPKDVAPDAMVAPMLDRQDVARGLTVLTVRTSDTDFAPIDSRLFQYRGETFLTSISHLRVARSRDGRRFTVEPKPAMAPATRDEEFGIEDPRITFIDGRYWINYSAISSRGVATGLAVTDDFRTFERRGVIFGPENRDVTVFPEKINGRYAALHRPSATLLGGRDMWLAYSPDLLHWGDHRFLCGRRAELWDSARIGGGAVPFKTDRGWVEIYHGANASDRYCLGGLLLDAKDPSRVIARSVEPLMEPTAHVERQGFFGNVVFTCGAVVVDGRVTIYYGASDEFTCGAQIGVDELLATLKPV